MNESNQVVIDFGYFAIPIDLRTGAKKIKIII